MENPDSNPRATLLPPGTEVGEKYSLKGVVGVGTTSIVYRAVQSELDRVVAVKVLSEGADDSAIMRDRFLREARAVAALSHRNIVKIYGQGELEGRPFLAMEYLPGQTLEKRVEDRGALSREAAFKVLGELLDGLDHAHERGVIHRDLSPANVFLSESERHKRVVIVDFGLCRRPSDPSDRRLTTPGRPIGTRLFAAPEQLLGLDVDYRADIYAAGALLHYMLTGATVVSPDQEKSALAQILEDPPPLPSDLRPGLGRQVDFLVQRALSKAPNERYQSADAFRRALALAKTGSEAPPAS